MQQDQLIQVSIYSTLTIVLYFIHILMPDCLRIEGKSKDVSEYGKSSGTLQCARTDL